MDNRIQEIDVVNIVTEFLEVCIHELLFLRNLYPPSIFVLRRMYNVPVHVSKHPGLNKYITESLCTVRELMSHKQVRSVAVCFYNEDEQPVERLVFDILKIHDKYKPNHDFSDPYLMKLREGMRSFCLRISTANLKPLREQDSFQIHVQTTEQGSEALASNPLFEDFPWVELEPREKDLVTPNLYPIRTIDADFLQLQIYVEKSSV